MIFSKRQTRTELMKHKSSKMQMRFLNNTVDVVVILFFKLMLSSYGYTAASALTVIPSWNDHHNDNGSFPCNLFKDSQNVTTFTGDSFQTCELKLISSRDTAALLRLSEQTSLNTFLYAERRGDLLNCQNRFLVITAVKPCSVLFWHREIQLFFEGNASNSINEIPFNRPSSLCPKLSDDGGDAKLRVSQTSHCQIKEFNHSVSCTRFPDNSCVFYDFPHNCNATINDMEVVFQCHDDDTFSNYTALLMYPVDIVSLDLRFNNIIRIDGSPFRRLRNLKMLELKFNKISFVDSHTFHGLYTLTFLSLKRNHLLTLDGSPFRGLQNLKTLKLDYNKLSFVDQQTFQELGTLTYLSLSGNRLVALHIELFSKLGMLQILYLDANVINNLPSEIFQNLDGLMELYLDSNNLTFLHQDLFSNFTVLTHLELNKNRLVSVASDLFKDLLNLSFLRLEKNQIISLHTNVFRRTRELIYLDLADNYITVLPKGLFKGLRKLNKLYLNENEIAALDEDTFNETPMLFNLDLAGNVLTYLPSELFSGLANLKYLDLGNNKITFLGEKLFNDNKNLMRAYLNNNSISVLPHDLFEGLIFLGLVFLQENRMVSLSEGMFNNITNIFTLDLSQNELSVIPNGLFKGLSKLELLDLQINQLVYLHPGLFDETKRLSYLYLQDNTLAVLPNGLFQGLKKLTVLSLNANNLKRLPNDIFVGLTNLESLFLQDNYMRTVDYQILRGLQSLLHLNLSHASIISLDCDLFQDTRKLEFLDLSGNKLERIPNINSLNRLTFLSLRDNSLIKITNRTFSNVSKDIYMIVSQPEICECYVSGDLSCNALDKISPYLTCSRLLSDRVLVIMMWLIGLNALFGNIFVLSYRKVKRDKIKGKIQTFLLSNLAMSDLLMGIYMLLIASADIYFGESFPMQAESWRSGITCKIAGTISIVSSEASVFFLTLISIDRFMNIKYPYSDRKLRKKSCVILVSVLWFISVVLGIVPSSLGGNSEYTAFYDNSHVCIGLPLALIKAHSMTIDKQLTYSGAFYFEMQEVKSEYLGEVSGMYFSSAMFLGLNCICFLIILLCYVEIVRDVTKSSKVRVGINKDMKEEIRLTVNVSVLILTDFVCWFPIIILGILVQARVLTLPPSVFAWCVTFILPINSAINPYLYTIAHVISSYRKEVHEQKVKSQRENQRKGKSTENTKL